MIIFSGMQTGVDQLAIETAIELGIAYGGFIPKGRRTEYGTIPTKYTEFIEVSEEGWMPRTKANIEHSDATLVLAMDKIQGGTKRTIEHALEMHKPCLCLRYIDGKFIGNTDDGSVVANFIADNDVEILNVAGPRMSRIQEQGSAFRLSFTEAVVRLLKNSLTHPRPHTRIKGFF